MHPFEVFPILVWEALLERVEDCADRMAIIRTHPALEALFENKSQEWLFAAAIPVIMKTTTREAISARQPFVVPSRLVSKSIYRAVNKSIEALWDNCADVPINLNIRSFALHPYFHYGFSVRRFLREFGDYPPNRSPLVNPYISVEVPFVNPRFPDMTEEERIQVFRKVGTHLKGLRLELEICHRGAVNPIERSRDLLEQILSLTPNLVHLWVPGDSFSQFINEDNDFIQELQRADKLNLPDLPFLRYIKVGHYMPPDEKDFLGLEKYFPQLTRLTLMWDHWKEEYYINSANFFPNLEYLHFWSMGLPQPSYWRSTNIRKFRNQLSNIYKIQAPKIKEFYLEIVHRQKEVLKSIVCAETRKGLEYLRERFEGESNWKCKTITERHPEIWDLALRRTTETGVNDGDFLEGDWEEDVLEMMIQNTINEGQYQEELWESIRQRRNIAHGVQIELAQEEEEVQNELEEKGLQRLSNIKTAVKFASATAILSAGVVFANRVNTPLAFCIPILLAAGLYNLS